MRRFIPGVLLLVISLTLGMPFLVNHLSPVRIEEREPRVRLYIHNKGELVDLPLEDYVTGVVAAEMPAAFPVEALKAQAVAARTFILRRLTAGGVMNNDHPGADACDEHKHGQAWISREEMRRRWGAIRYYEYYYKLRQAVDETRGLVMIYQGHLIDPAYHASCGGRGTENASAVWKYDVPYLRGVPCPYDADPQPVRAVTLPVAKVDRALGVRLEAMAVSGGFGTGTEGANPVQVLERTAAGRPKTVRIGEREVAATVVRDLLGLRSTDFNFSLKGDEVEITTRGYGHAVGMCQYGAKGLAEHGYTFDRILKHYYTGVEITRMAER